MIIKILGRIVVIDFIGRRQTYMPSDVIQLDVGGQLFRTTKSTLCSVDGYFSAMLQGGHWGEDKQDAPIFIDRGKA